MKFIKLFLLGALFASAMCTDIIFAADLPAPAVADDRRVLPYAQPGQLIDIGGRRINLVCMGDGGPVVILMAGLFSWSVVWHRTQPAIAQKTRVCAFDRASYGFSDPSTRPQILFDPVEDLDAAIHAASIPSPYVLVGHSLGGVEARLYEQRWPQEVAGMVLVDTALADEGLIDEAQQGFDDFEQMDAYVSSMLHCAQLSASGPLDVSKPEFEECTSISALPSGTPAAYRAMWPRFFPASYFTDKVSLLVSLYTHRYDSVDHLRLGAMPLVVLSAEYSSGRKGTPEGEWFHRTYFRTWIRMHEALARLSTRGVHRLVRGSGHTIQLEQPQAVIDAVNEVLTQQRPGC